MKQTIYLVTLILMLTPLTTLKAQKIEGELKKWHNVTLVFDGPECSETDEFNPFLNYRLNVTFEHEPSGKKYLIPGYFAADGNAGETSATSGNKWKVHFAPDEPGDHRYALIPDKADPDHFNARTNGLWGAMLAGAWGTEWYFGYEHPHSDLTCEDWRSRDLFWDMGKICLDFFYNNDLPVDKMREQDELISSDNDYCFALEGDTYIILLKNGGESALDLKDNEGEYSVLWYDTRNGGELQKGEVKTIQGGGKKSLGLPPKDVNKDWVVLVKKK